LEKCISSRYSALLNSLISLKLVARRTEIKKRKREITFDNKIRNYVENILW
jgi:hypothetical protein